MKENSIKNERSSIEEDMKILEEFKTHGYAMLLIKYEDRNKTNLKIEQAIEHILSDYKRVLKENEELLEVKVSASANNRILELEKENEELKNQEATARRINELLVQRYSNSIPVQIVKDKIEKIKQEKKKYGNCLIEMYEDELVNRDIKILQELIEEREEK